ncbi:MAG TPA: hypothetical protein VK992_04255 [Candidatus Caenarcaniphilales bacterium]|nr:hypothetical protein [Candidatus Caenarcaniphilales bacterium]
MLGDGRPALYAGTSDAGGRDADEPCHSRLLVHHGDSERAEQIGNVVARPAAKGWAIDAAIDARTEQPRRIIAAQAAMLAVHRAMTAPKPPSRTIGFRASLR